MVIQEHDLDRRKSILKSVVTQEKQAIQEPNPNVHESLVMIETEALELAQHSRISRSSNNIN
jgi:hypothetical protein